MNLYSLIKLNHRVRDLLKSRGQECNWRNISHLAEAGDIPELEEYHLQLWQHGDADIGYIGYQEADLGSRPNYEAINIWEIDFCKYLG